MIKPGSYIAVTCLVFATGEKTADAHLETPQCFKAERQELEFPIEIKTFVAEN